MALPFPLPSVQIPGLEGLLGGQLLTGVGALAGGIVVGLVVGYLIGWYKYYWRHRHKWGLIQEAEMKHY